MQKNYNYIYTLFLFIAGLLITLVSAFFSIKGFLLFLPDPELVLGILGLGIAFEVAKVVVSTFLFHHYSDKNFPWMVKGIMTIAVVSLIIFSSIFSYVHLNASASKNFATNTNANTTIERLEARNKTLEVRLQEINNEISSINENYTTAKIRMVNALSPEKQKIEEELKDNLQRIEDEGKSVVENDQYIFLESLSKLSGLENDKIFSYVIAFIVLIIDPLAICLFISGSYIFTKREDPLLKDTILHYSSTPDTPLSIDNETIDSFVEENYIDPSDIKPTINLDSTIKEEKEINIDPSKFKVEYFYPNIEKEDTSTIKEINEEKVLPSKFNH